MLDRAAGLSWKIVRWVSWLCCAVLVGAGGCGVLTSPVVEPEAPATIDASPVLTPSVRAFTPCRTRAECGEGICKPTPQGLRCLPLARPTPLPTTGPDGRPMPAAGLLEGAIRFHPESLP